MPNNWFSRAPETAPRKCYVVSDALEVVVLCGLGQRRDVPPVDRENDTQRGVELGKLLAKTKLPELADEHMVASQDFSTNGVINYYKPHRSK